ncbi:hypothetical protein Tco_0688164 [Tanacetum coccineum]
MCEQGKMKAIPFMAPLPADYHKTMPWVEEKPFIYSVLENTCNEAKLYDLDETGEGIVKGNFLYVKKDPSKKSPHVWKSVRYGVSKELDTAYWGFLEVGTTLDIFQNIIFIPYLEYGILRLSGYGVLSFILCGLW